MVRANNRNLNISPIELDDLFLKILLVENIGNDEKRRVRGAAGSGEGSATFWRDH